MEELKDTSIHHTAIKFSEDVKNMKIYGNLFKTVQVSVWLYTETVRKKTGKSSSCNLTFISTIRNWLVRRM